MTLIGAHLHDGGVNLEMKVNDKLVCDSRATYGGQKGTLKTNSSQVWQTISSISECTEPIKVSVGDNVTLQANYDLVKHPL
jgi:hypothetical protein